MKRIVTASLIASTLIFSPTQAAMTPLVSDVMAMKDEMESGSFQGRAAWTALMTYLQGGMEALGMMQQAMETRDDKGAFCPPKGTSMSMQDVFESLERASKAGQNGPALSAILADFQQQYPCRP